MELAVTRLLMECCSHLTQRGCWWPAKLALFFSPFPCSGRLGRRVKAYTGLFLVFLASFLVLLYSKSSFASLFTSVLHILPSFSHRHWLPTIYSDTSWPLVFPLFIVQTYNRLGVHWASSLFGFIALAMMPLPWVVLPTWVPDCGLHQSSI